MQAIIHYFLHLVFPILIAYGLYRKQWLKVYVTFLLAMLIDLDHLLATPIFSPCRCSVGFHPLHSTWSIILYGVLLIIPKTRIIGFALLWHIVTDGIDCILMKENC